jgi:hypothetical protein
MLTIPQVDDVARFYATEPGKWQVSIMQITLRGSWNSLVDNWMSDNYASAESYPNYFNLRSSYNFAGSQRDDFRELVCGFTHSA